MNIGVVIVTYNNAHSLSECIQSIKKEKEVSIVVVDNNSSDSTVEVAQKADVAIYQNEENYGFATAANQGAKEVKSPYILFLNPDATLKEGSLQIAAEYLEKNPSVGVVGLALTSFKSHRIEPYSFGKFPTLVNLITRKLSSDDVPTSPTEADWVSGGALLIRRDLFKRISGFDTNFFLYWEDVDLCYRAKNQGYSVVLLPSAQCEHQRGASLGDQKLKAKLYDAGADRYFRKHYPFIIWGIQRYLRLFYRLFQPYSR